MRFLGIVPYLIGFVCLQVAGCVTSSPTVQSYGYAPEVRYTPQHSRYMQTYHPCPSNGHPDDICNRQQPWPSGQ